MIEIAGPGQADNGMDKDSASDLRGSALRQFFVRAVHGITRLEGHHALVSETLQKASH
jgi:hypothetical protein